MNLTTQLDSEAFSAMHQVVDPYGEHRQCGCLKGLPEVKVHLSLLQFYTTHTHTRVRTHMHTHTHTHAHSLTHTHVLTHTHTHILTHTHALTHKLATTCPPPYTIVAVYIDRLTMPKLMICTGGDEFFQPDDSIFYWDQLKEPKFIR